MHNGQQVGLGEMLSGVGSNENEQHHPKLSSKISIDVYWFVTQLQRAADWLADRRVLPEHLTVADFLAPVSAG